jgi:2-polyprenyl-3-methyl-5-hydroxy-6-metoxy-1,4-benzoquinol methylase
MADYPELSAESQAIWEANGAWWGGVMGDGNRWHRELIAPATERLLSIRAGERVLDLACGNGQFSRRMAELGAHVVACDVSASMLQCARSRGVNDIDYRRMDLANPSELAALGEAEFDAAVCTMALMDMAMIGPHC